MAPVPLVDLLARDVTGILELGALDGWDWFVDELTGWVDSGGDPAVPVASAVAVGELAARLHGALATPSEVLAHPVTKVDPATERGRAESLLRQALEVASGEAADVLRARAAAIRAVLDGWPSGGATPAIPLHGDLHIGQVLRSPGRLVVTDFDGNPLLDPAERHRPRPAAVDVASLVQSVDHAARVAQRRRPGHAGELDALARELTAATLAGYRRQLAALGHSELLDDRLLWPLRVTQELHELVYAAQYLARWAYVPTAALRSMFAIDADADPS